MGFNGGMDWSATIPALLGTVVGGTVTIFGQSRADRRRDASAVNAVDRAAQRAQIERERRDVRELHDRVSEDLAWIRGQILRLDDAGNFERLEGLAPIALEIAARRDRAASLIAVVTDEGVRDAADEVYEAWNAWVGGEIDRLGNDLDSNPVDPMRPIGAREQLAESVRAALRALDKMDAPQLTTGP